MSSTSEVHAGPNYAAIFATLLVLTLITVGVSRVHLGFAGNLALAVAVATVKGLLVAMYFMHLKFERRHLVLLITVPLLLVLVFILGLLPDIVYGKM